MRFDIEKGVYLFLTIFIVFYPFLAIPWDINYLTLTKFLYLLIIVLLTWAIFFIRWVRERRIPWVFQTKGEKLVLLFLFFGFLSTIFSQDFMISFYGSKDKYIGFITWLSFISLFIFTYHLVPINKQVKIVRYIIYASFLSGVYGIIQHFFLDKLVPWHVGTYFVSSWSFFDNSNHFGTYLVIMIILAMTYYLMTSNVKEYMLMWLIIGTLFVSMLYTMSRGSWVALFVGIVMLTLFTLLKRKDLWKRWGILLASLVLVSLVVNLTEDNIFLNQSARLGTDISSVLTSEEITEEVGSGRWGIWQRTIEIIKDNYIIGTGPSSFPLVFPYPESGIYDQIDNSHNDYLEIAMSMGIPALIIYLAFMFTILKKAWSTLLRLNGDQALFLFGLITVIISYLIKVLFNISVIPVAPFFWVLLGICYSFSIKVKTVPNKC